MQGALPLKNITVIGLALVALFVIAGTILIVTGHAEEGTNAMATATGIVIGTIGTTAVVGAANATTTTPDDKPTPPTQ
jgi:hypothetical protein